MPNRSPLGRLGARAPRRLALLAGAALLSAPVLASGHGDAPITDRTPVTFHVDADRGSDDASGRSPGEAWRSLDRVADEELAAGDRVLLRRGQSWKGDLELEHSGVARLPIVLGAYGEGDAPRIEDGGSCVVVRADHVTIRDLRIQDCSWAGVEVYGTSVMVERNLLTGNAAGVAITNEAVDTVVRHNRLIDNDRMSVLTEEPDDDSGAFGVLVSGTGARIVENVISGSRAFSHDYGNDGAAIEIFGAKDTLVARNRASGNDAFTELGSPGTENTIYLQNVITSPHEGATFLVTHGSDDHLGPVAGTIAERNTVRLTGGGSEGFVCVGTCPSELLSVRRNIVEAEEKVGYASGDVDQGDNLFWGRGALEFTLGEGSRRAAPAYRDADAGDLRLRTGLVSGAGVHAGPALPKLAWD